MEESILESVKKMLGMTPEYTAYDEDVKIAINTTFNVCYQLGVGPDQPFYISSKEEKWSDFTEDRKTIEMVKTYMFMKVKLIFDPPLNSSVLESYKQMAAEYEWRLHIEDDLVRHYVPDEYDDGSYYPPSPNPRPRPRPPFPPEPDPDDPYDPRNLKLIFDGEIKAVPKN